MCYNYRKRRKTKGCVIVAYFFETTETIPDGLGFDAYGPLHIGWLMFPFLLLVGGFNPNFKRLWKSLPYAIPVVVFVYIFNKIFDTDFMFLNGGGEGNPIAFFAEKLGDPLYIITIPFLIGLVWSVLYGVPYLAGKLRKKMCEIR